MRQATSSGAADCWLCLDPRPRVLFEEVPDFARAVAAVYAPSLAAQKSARARL